MANYLQDLLGEAYKEGMTMEEISSALESAGITTKDENSNEIKHYKELVSKANSEAASYKKAMKEKLSEQERAEVERKEQFEAMQAELNQYKQDKILAEYTSQFVSQGYAADIASVNAKAFMGNDLETLLKNQADLINSIKATTKSELLKSTPRPEHGNANGSLKTMTKKDLYALSPSDRLKFAKEHREEYEKLNKGEEVQI